MPVGISGYTPISADEELIAIQNVFKSVFGINVDLDPAGVVGLFVQQLTNMGMQVENALSILYGQIYNPNFSYGRFLDAICAFTEDQRREASSSTITCTCTGLSGVVIPVNSQILNENGDIFINPAIITIPGGGSVSGAFQSLATGEIPCGANTVNRIVQQIAGWDTVTNPTDGTLGQPEETDANLRFTRTQSLGKSSTNTIDAVLSALAEEPTIENWYANQNRTANPVTIQGVTLAANSIYVVAYGGTNQVVAKILYDKAGFCTMNGDTTVNYTDVKYSWITAPMTFERPAEVPIYIKVSIGASSAYPADIVTQIQNAFVANFYGTNGINAFVQIGQVISASRFIPTLYALGISAIYSCQISIDNTNFVNTITLDIDEVPTLISANITVLEV